MATRHPAQTARLDLRPFSGEDFGRFVAEMLTDARVTEFYYSYKDVDDVETIRQQADKDFWDHFQDSRDNHGLEIWAAYENSSTDRFVGWSGLLHTTLSEEYGGPELQYMIAGDAHGRGYATEMAAEVLRHADEKLKLKSVIATVDIPNTGSIRVLEKLGFEHEGQIEAYGSSNMFLYRRTFNSGENSQ